MLALTLGRIALDGVQAAGYRTACAFGGKEGLAAFNAALSASAPFSAVVTDFSMPDLDGLRVAAAVKDMAPATAVVLVTAYAVNGDDELPRHVDAVLRKPPSQALLHATLARVIAAPNADRR